MAAKRAILVVFLTLPLSVPAQRVESQIDRARLSPSPPGMVDLPQSAGASLPGPAAAAVDHDSFGRQVLLKRQERARPFSAFAEIGAFVTNNVALVRRDEQEDSFLSGSAGAAFSHRFAFPLRVDLTARAGAYRYSELRELDFQSIDLSGGVSWTAPWFSGVEIFARYAYSQLTSASDRLEFYHNHGAIVGAQKAVALSRALALYAGATAQWNFSEPEPTGRDEYGAYAGCRAQLARNLDADLLYRYSRHVYRRGEGRRDHNQAVALTVRFTPAEWLSLSASGFYGVNRSNQPVFDYEVGNLGVSVQVSARF